MKPQIDIFDPDKLRHEGLISNLWVILATILTSATLSLPFADTNQARLASGFGMYLFANILALVLAYKGAIKISLISYTTFVFFSTTVAMILLNDQPAHMVLAMANFVLLNAVVLGGRSALVVTSVMALLLLFAYTLGESIAPYLIELAGGENAQVHLDESTTLSSLVTTTVSTGYIIFTSINIQERSRREIGHAHRRLALAQTDLQQRHDRARCLSDLGATAAAVNSLEHLHTALHSTLSSGLPDAGISLIKLSEQTEDGVIFGRGPNALKLATTRNLNEDEKRFAQTVADLVNGVHARMEADSRLHTAERLDDMGRLAASIAHDFNNLLVPITATYDLIEHHTGLDAKMRAYVEPARRATGQAKALLNRLLVHASSSEPKLVRTDLTEVIQSSEPLLRTFVSDGRELRIELPNEPIFVLADPVQLEQVLLNLVLNALNAVPENGYVVVTLSRTHGRANIEVKDNGPGIPIEIRDWVLEPFHSTRLEGSGLGLSTVTRIARAGGGNVSIGTASEGGASVVFTLPASPPPSPQPKVEAVSYESGRSLAVLLVEDNHQASEILKEMLEALGHTCFQANDGHTALVELGENRGIDVVLTDYQMPVLNGAQLINEMRKRKDLRPVILMSGYGSSITDSLESQPDAILGKPIRLNRLEEVITQVTHIQEAAI